jgi:hypothetical protein
MNGTNRKPPDELADVRERIKELKGREDELRDLLIAGADPIGDEFVATVKKVSSERIDGKKIRRDLGHEFLEPFLVEVESTVVNVERMRGEG